MTEFSAGWYPDPHQANTQRYYDGTDWTEQRAPMPAGGGATTQPTGDAESPTSFARLTLPQRVSLGSISVVVIAAFLPWVSIFGISASGIQGDGVITLVLAVAGLAVLALTSRAFRPERVAGKPSQITLVVLAVLVALVGLLDMNGAAAIGLYLTLLAGLAWLGAATWEIAAPRSSRNVS